MAWIKVIEESEGEGVLREIYQDIREKRGKISNILKVHSLNPEAMKAHLELYVALMFENSSLTRVEREMLGVVVSSANRCEYCVRHHGVALNHFWKDEGRVAQLAEDHHGLDLEERHQRMLEYAIKLTKSPREVRKEDVERLREHGFKDEDILNINLITSYFNFVNRIVLGLGVTFKEEEISGYQYERKNN